MKRLEDVRLDDAVDVDTLVAVLREHPVRTALLFGSHVRGAAHGSSDVDVAVEFDSVRPTDTDYNDVFLSLSADLSAALGTDAVDLVDLRTASPALAESIFAHGVLLVGERDHATTLRRELVPTDADSPTPRERLDRALARIDEHLSCSDAEVPATGDSDSDRSPTPP